VKKVGEYVTHVELNRPDKLNAMNHAMWKEIPECFGELNSDPKCRAVVLSGAGRIFTSGLDFSDMGQLMAIYQSEDDVARKFKKMYSFVKPYQDSFTSLEKCSKPVIAAVHNACIGGGVDLICAADIRYCTSDSWFQIKEVDIGLAADVGTLQRLPRIVGNESLVRELAFSCRKLYSDEAKSFGLVSRIFPDKDKMLEEALRLASVIASKSPVAVQGTKANLIYSRDHSVEEGLAYQAIWNSAMLQSEDLMKAAMAQMNKADATFNDF
jgi:delta(3,5)-delta(2,4)-dienoyl-CoA isomerase